MVTSDGSSEGEGKHENKIGEGGNKIKHEI